MDVRAAIYGRRSIRDYTEEVVPDQLLVDLITDATQAPSAMNRQLWSFNVVRDREKLGHYSAEAKACVLAASGDQIDPALKAMLTEPTFNIFYNAPTLVVICARETDAFAREDGCLAEQNLMLSAYARGLGTCRIGFADAWLKTPDAKAELCIADSSVPVAAVIVGWPKTAPQAPPRSAPEITWISGGPASD